MIRIYFSVFLMFSVLFVNAQVIEFEDENFKAKLLQSSSSNEIAKDGNGKTFKIDANNNGEIEESEALVVDELKFYGKMSDLTGLEYFKNLTRLSCGECNLEYFDVSENIKLESLTCVAANLKSLDVKKNVNLKNLRIEVNPISNIDLSQNKELTKISCYNTGLTSLNLSNNTKLKSLICFGNPELEWINIKNGLVQEIDNLHLPKLKSICVDETELESIRDQIEKYNLEDVDVSLGCESLSTTDFEFNDELTLYPNPVNDRLNITSKGQTQITSIEIYNLQGQVVLSVPQFITGSVDVSQLPKGTYLVKAKTDKGVATTKIVKE